MKSRRARLGTLERARRIPATPPLATVVMAGNAKERLERLLGELDRSAETPAGEDPELDDYPDYDEGNRA